MDFATFCDTIRANLQEKLGKNVTIRPHSALKNNNIMLQGLSIMKQECNIAPLIYLNYFYDAYKRGKPLSEIEAELFVQYQELRQTQSLDMSFFTDWNQVKERVIFRLVSYERNKELLKNIPHIPFLDLAIIFYVFLGTVSSDTAVIPLQNHCLELWNLSLDELYQTALQNTPCLLKPVLHRMSDFLNANLGDDVSAGFDHGVPIYILTNEYSANGAGCILYKDLLKTYAEQLECDFYVLPSSIHETLLVPCAHGSKEELSAIVKSINATQVSKEEILSYHVYCYSRENNRILL